MGSTDFVLSKFYEIHYLDPKETGSYIGTGQLVSKSEDGLYEFLLPDGEIACFKKEDIIKETQEQFCMGTKLTIQKLLEINTVLKIQMQKKTEEIKKLLVVCAVLKQKILDPSLDVESKLKDIK